MWSEKAQKNENGFDLGIGSCRRRREEVSVEGRTLRVVVKNSVLSVFSNRYTEKSS